MDFSIRVLEEIRVLRSEKSRKDGRKEKKKKKVPREAGEEEMMMKKKTERKEGRGDSLASKNTDGIRRMINYW